MVLRKIKVDPLCLFCDNYSLPITFYIVIYEKDVNTVISSQLFCHVTFLVYMTYMTRRIYTAKIIKGTEV